jgi:hypothetical protein
MPKKARPHVTPSNGLLSTLPPMKKRKSRKVLKEMGL